MTFPQLCKLAVLAILLASVAPAGRIEERDGQTVIHVTVFGLPDPGATDTFTRAEAAAVQAFRERFAGIFAERWRDRYRADPERYGDYDWNNVRVELEKFSGIQVEGVENDLLAIAGGMAPDVLYINFRKSDNYIRSGFLHPLDDYLATMSQAEIDFRVHPKIWPVIRRRGSDGQTRTWAYPFGGALGKVMLYRKDLFDRHGLPHPTVDYTWDDLLEACKRITDPAAGTYGILLGRGASESWHWCTFLWSAGGEVMEYDEAVDQWRCTFDTPEAAVALDFYTRLSAERWVDAGGRVRRGYSSKDASDSWAMWDRGQIGVLMAYIDERVFSTINPELTGMVPVPLGPGGQRGGELNSRMMGLFAETAHPAVRDAAWEYIRYIDGEEAVGIKTRIMVEGGLGRFVNPRYLRQFGYPEIERLAPKGWSETFEIAVATGHPEPYGKNSNLAYNLMTLPIQKAEQMMLDGQLPADDSARLAVLRQLLVDANARANREMIGLVTPRQQLVRRAVASLALVGILAAFGSVFYRISKIFAAPPDACAARGCRGFRKYFWAYLLLLPAVLTILVWQYVPLLRGSLMALFDYQLLGRSLFVGVDNFGEVLFDGIWWQSVWNALRYSFLVMTLTFLPPIILAVALQEVPRCKLLFRLIFYLPAVISGIVTVLLWKQFYLPSERGALNFIVMRIPAVGFLAIGLLLLLAGLAFARRLWLQSLTLPAWGFVVVGALACLGVWALALPILRPAGESLAASLAALPGRLFAVAPEPWNWLGNPKTAMLSCVIPMVWAGMGPGCLIYLAALKGIPEDFYEAADLDGATFIDKLLFVVFPYLKPLILINFVGVFIASWYSAAGNILVMTGGGGNTQTVDLYIWYKAFTFLKFGPAMAMAWMLGFMLIGFTVHQLRILSRVEFRAQGAGK